MPGDERVDIGAAKHTALLVDLLIRPVPPLDLK